MQSFTPDFNKNINAQVVKEPWLELLTITHPDLPTPIRIVNDTDDVVHQGDTYTALPFGIQLPDNPETGASVARITVDNVGRTLTDWLEVSKGGTDANVTITVILRSDPNTAQFEATNMTLSNVTMTNTQVTARLTYDDIYNKPAIRGKYSPSTTPGVY